MNRRIIQAMFLVVVIVALVACAAQEAPPAASVPAAAEPVGTALPDLPKNAAGYVDLSVEQLAAAMPGDDFTLVNVHIPYEGELPNTDLFVPFNEILAHQDELPAKDAPIVLYCRSGNMSTQAAQELAAAGYTNVYEVNGGFIRWQAAGHDLLMKE